jgi:hypothetical protein
MNNDSFCGLFCAKHKCQPDDFDMAVFRRCLYPNRYYLGRLLMLVNQDYFDSDFALIEAVKNLTNVREINVEIDAFRHTHPQKGLFRHWLKVHISGQRLLNEATIICQKAPSGGRSDTSRAAMAAANSPVPSQSEQTSGATSDATNDVVAGKRFHPLRLTRRTTFAN